MPINITIPHNFVPREYQLPALAKMDGPNGLKRAVTVWHRRAGKEKTWINFMAAKSVDRIGTYFYLFPTYAQAKKVLWDGKDGSGFPFMGHFPKEYRKSQNESELRLELINGSAIQLIGTDNIDSVVGSNPIGCVFSEYALQDPSVWDYIRPILRENGGWAVFDFTPRGKNHGYKLYEMAKDNPEWFAQILTVEDTFKIDNGVRRRVITDEDIDAERREGMSEEMIQQEYYCSFEGIQVGSYYGRELKNAEALGHYVRDLYDPSVQVETWWDIGVGDSTSIWFTQSVGHEVHVIDYLEASGEGIGYFARELQKKPYIYKSHNGPEDLNVREWGSAGRDMKPITRLASARQLGINFNLVPDVGLEDGINAARQFIARCWFDKVACARGLDALQSYHKEWNDKMMCFKSTPRHDWSSHGADAFRYLAVGHKTNVVQKKRAQAPLLGWCA